MGKGLDLERDLDLDVAVRGGRRSLEILEKLAAKRLGSIVERRASRAIGEIRWVPAQSYSIQRDQVREVWHAGHVSALLSDGNQVIAGAQTGGVWLLTPSVLPHYRQGHSGQPLAETWETPNVSALAYGPDGTRHVFVGCSDVGALYLLEFEPVFGGMSFKQAITLPLPSGSGWMTYAIVVLGSPRRVVVATNLGVWWSPIPQTVTDAGGYGWKTAQGLPAATYSGLCAGPDGSIAAAIWSVPPTEFILAPISGIYRGTWQNQNASLVFTESRIEGTDPDLMRRTSLASCDDQRSRMYAVAAAQDDSMLAVLSSSDGGATWRTRTHPGNTGYQGFYNNCIVVSPQRPDVVVVGWRSGGPFWSQDGMESWLQPTNDGPGLPGFNEHLHADIHTVYFVRNPSGPERLYAGSDGGIVSTRDMGHTYESQFSRPLHNLQFYGAETGLTAGSLTASSRYPGLLAGGTQDNGNIYLYPDRDAGTPWFTLEGGDGGLNRFVDPIGALLRWDNTGVNVRIHVFDGTKNRFPPGGDTVVPADDNAAGVSPTSMEVVRAPAYKRNGKLMYAIVATGTTGTIYGLFADADATDATFVKLGSVGTGVSALASVDGSTLIVGTGDGRLMAFDSATGTTTAYTLPPFASGMVTRLEAISANYALALMGGDILRFDGTAWTAATRWGWVTFAADPESGRIFAATDGDVFVSHDQGMTWVDASLGLPARPHCTDLRVAAGADGKGGRDLYLATYGRSVWRAAIAYVDEGPDFELPPVMAEILFGVIQDGGGVIRVGTRLIKVPPRPVIREILGALAVEDLARGMTAGSDAGAASARAIQRTALEQIARLALRELDQLG